MCCLPIVSSASEILGRTLISPTQHLLARSAGAGGGTRYGLRDSDIRLRLDAMLREVHSHESDSTLIRHEVGLCAAERRIDVAVINGEFTGYEIKSDEDTLRRLAGQVQAYGRVLDRAILVTTKRHLQAAIEELPAWWGIMLATETDGEIAISYVRCSSTNVQQDSFSLAQQLWRDEALEELQMRGRAGGLGKKARYYVWLALAEAVSIDELRQIVRNRVKARQGWSGGQLHGQCGEQVPIGPTP
jgi:hypothetical protein